MISGVSARFMNLNDNISIVLSNMPVKNMYFNPASTRLPPDLQSERCVDIILNENVQYVIFATILNNRNVLQLKKSIGEYGYMEAFPVFVREIWHTKYLILRGNCRVAAVKSLIAKARSLILKKVSLSH